MGADIVADKAQAWLVVGTDRHRSVFLDQETAYRYAVRVHGLVYALFFGRRRSDDQPASEALFYSKGSKQ